MNGFKRLVFMLKVKMMGSGGEQTTSRELRSLSEEIFERQEGRRMLDTIYLEELEASWNLLKLPFKCPLTIIIKVSLYRDKHESKALNHLQLWFRLTLTWTRVSVTPFQTPN